MASDAITIAAEGRNEQQINITHNKTGDTNAVKGIILSILSPIQRRIRRVNNDSEIK